MALKDLIIDRHTRAAMEIVEPVWFHLFPAQISALMKDIIAALRVEQDRK